MKQFFAIASSAALLAIATPAWGGPSYGGGDRSKSPAMTINAQRSTPDSGDQPSNDWSICVNDSSGDDPGDPIRYPEPDPPLIHAAEPAGIALLGAALLSLGMVRRRRGA